MAYTEQERRLLAHYFSETDPKPHADVYLVQNLPPEVAATLNGVYSRSALSMRDNFLERLHKGLAASGRTLADLPLGGGGSDAITAVMADRSGQFLKTYAIDHGHNSLREGSVLHLAVENVSQLVTRFVQRERRCSFEESSTRYISFSREGHWRDPDVQAAGGEPARAYDEILHTTFALYQELSEALLAHLQAVRPRAQDEKEGPWLRALRAEAFDAARYLLTPAIHTKWGFVVDARTLSDVIAELASHPLAEFRIVADRLREQAVRVVPTLLAHARRNEFLAAQHALRPAHAAATGAPEPVTGPQASRVTLLAHDPELDDKLLASLLYESSQQPYAACVARVRELGAAARQELLARCLAARGPRDPLPFALEAAQPFDFEILVDFGAYRDIGRHRKGIQQQQPLTTLHGYVVPPLLEQAGLAARYQRTLDAAAELQQIVHAAHPWASAYVTPFAFLQRARILFDPRQVGYFIELRSGPEGHFAYRRIALDMLAEVRRVSPLFAQCIRAQEGDAFLGRMTAEQGADERRRRRMERAGDLPAGNA